jgi:H+/Cl- antiporter ClcA
MFPHTPLPLVWTRSASDALSLAHACPTTIVTPDANGWVPPGTCGYISRPYYPSFVAASIFCAAAASVLIGYLSLICRSASCRHRWPRQEKKMSPRNSLRLPWFGALIATCLLAAYVLRSFGTRHQQVPEFVAFSDTLVLICPICESFASALCAHLESLPSFFFLHKC